MGFNSGFKGLKNISWKNPKICLKEHNDDRPHSTDWNWQPTKHKFPYSDEELYPYSGPENSNNRDNVLTVAGIDPSV